MAASGCGLWSTGIKTLSNVTCPSSTEMQLRAPCGTKSVGTLARCATGSAIEGLIHRGTPVRPSVAITIMSTARSRRKPTIESVTFAS